MSFDSHHWTKWAGLARSFGMLATGLLLSLKLCQAQVQPSDPTPPPELVDASEEALISDREEVELIDDSNVAEAISRRPDLQYQNVIVDGERSELSLNDIPADAISEVELLRAVTPDMDADSRGGSLNLSSNPIFNLEAPVLKADIWGNYSEGEQTWAQGASLSYSRPMGDFGFRINASTSNKHDILEGFYLRWSPKDAINHLYAPDYLIESREEEWKINHNFGATLDYRVSDQLHTFIRLNYSETGQEGYQPRIFFRFVQGLDDEYRLSSMPVNNAQIDRDLTAFESQWDQISFQTGIVVESDNWKFDARLLGEIEGYVEPDWFVIQFQSAPLKLSYQLNEKNLPVVVESSVDIEDPANFYFDELLSERWSTDNERWVVSTNLRYDFNFRGVDAFAKSGLKWTRRTKDQRSDSRIYTSYNGDFTLADIPWEYNADSLLVEGINWGTFATLADSRDYFHQNFDNFGYDLKRSAQKGHPGTYAVEEIISSAYTMLSMTRNRLRGIIGLRVERTDLDYSANAVLVDQFGNYLRTEARIGSNSYTEFFPSAHLRYFLGSKTTLIGSWTGTIERPFYGSMVPFQYINYDSLSIDEGNPKLKPTLYNNLDFSMDYKLSENSLFSIELFAKEVEDIVYWEVTEITDGQYAAFTLGTNANGPSATEKGVRFILTQNLADLSEYFENFSLILKYSLQDSETQYPGRDSETLPVTYHPENSFEATLTYQGEKLFAQIQYAYQTSELVAVYEEAWQDKFDIPNEDLSISASYNITDHIRAYGELSGLLESYAKTYYGIPERPSAYAWRSKKLEFGLKINL